MPYYIELNSEDIAIGMSLLADYVENDRLILVDSPDVTLMGKKYQNGQFVVVPPTPKYNSYSLAEFIDALTDDEYGVIREMVMSTTNTVANRKAKRIWDWWGAHGIVDFNDQRTVNAVTWLVTNTTEWTVARGNALKGTLS